MVENKIEDLLLLKFQEPEFATCFILEITISASKKVEIILDADDGLTFGMCQRISRYIENYLDTEGVLGEVYVLEVSSPGVTRPLVLPRQYPKHIGRDLEVEDTEGVQNVGELTEVTEKGISIAFEKVEKVGKKKVIENVLLEIPFEKIKSAIVKLAF
jgi:ribosome maturation factor RimP